MTLNDLLCKNLRVLGLGLILSCSGASDAGTAGCKNDSECKGNRYCIDGECVEGSGNGGGEDVYTSKDTSSNCQDECTAGESRCASETSVEKCVKNNNCNTWETVEECGSEEYCESIKTTALCKCNPNLYENSCEGLILTYCDPDKEVVASVDCNDYGMSNCGYAHQTVVKAVCFGDGKLGAKCELPPLSPDTEETDWKYFIKVECDFNDVELFCDGDYCTKMCEQDSDCSGELPSCTKYVSSSWCAPEA